jgi:hypothetical protein
MRLYKITGYRDLEKKRCVVIMTETKKKNKKHKTGHIFFRNILSSVHRANSYVRRSSWSGQENRGEILGMFNRQYMQMYL